MPLLLLLATCSNLQQSSIKSTARNKVDAISQSALCYLVHRTFMNTVPFFIEPVNALIRAQARLARHLR